MKRFLFVFIGIFFLVGCSSLRTSTFYPSPYTEKIYYNFAYDSSVWDEYSVTSLAGERIFFLKDDASCTVRLPDIASVNGYIPGVDETRLLQENGEEWFYRSSSSTPFAIFKNIETSRNPVYVSLRVSVTSSEMCIDAFHALMDTLTRVDETTSFLQIEVCGEEYWDCHDTYAYADGAFLVTPPFVADHLSSFAMPYTFSPDEKWIVFYRSVAADQSKLQMYSVINNTITDVMTFDPQTVAGVSNYGWSDDGSMLSFDLVLYEDMTSTDFIQTGYRVTVLFDGDTVSSLASVPLEGEIDCNDLYCTVKSI